MRLSGCGGEKSPAGQMDTIGLGLWSAAQAIRAHKGELVLGNWGRRGRSFCAVLED